MSKTVEIEDLKKIMNEGIKIRDRRWINCEYTYYCKDKKEWMDEEGELFVVGSDEIYNGAYEYYHQAYQCLGQLYLKAADHDRRGQSAGSVLLEFPYAGPVCLGRHNSRC